MRNTLVNLIAISILLAPIAYGIASDPIPDLPDAVSYTTVCDECVEWSNSTGIRITGTCAGNVHASSFYRHCLAGRCG